MSWPVPDLLACHPMTHFSANKSSELDLTFGFPFLTTIQTALAALLSTALVRSCFLSPPLLSQVMPWSADSGTWVKFSLVPLCSHPAVTSTSTYYSTSCVVLSGIETEVILDFGHMYHLLPVPGSALYSQAGLYRLYGSQIFMFIVIIKRVR